MNVKTLHIITGLNTGGAEMMLYKLILTHHREKFNMTVVSLTDLGDLGSAIVEQGVPVVSIGMKMDLTIPKKFFRLIKEIKKQSPDIVQTWMYHADLIGGIAAKMAGIEKIVWNIRHSGLTGNKLLTRIIAKVCAILSRSIPDKIICNSVIAASMHQAMGYSKDKFVIIPNGFDIERFCADEQAKVSLHDELGLPGNVLLVGLVARFDAQKNHQLFIEAAALLKAKMDNVHFVLCGRGVDENNERLSEWIREAQLESEIHLLGLRKDTPGITAALDVATSCSSYGEGFSNVIGEAMACEVPCVVTDVGDSAFIVGGTGEVVPPGEPKALADAWEKLLKLDHSERHKLGGLARKRVQDNFLLSRIVSRYESLYWELLERNQENKNGKIYQ